MLRKLSVLKEDLPNFRDAIDEGVYVSGKRVMKCMCFFVLHCKVANGIYQVYLCKKTESWRTMPMSTCP